MIDNYFFSIDPNNPALEFLANRILKTDYRGLQISQHNRYNYEQVVKMLELFYSLVGEKKMQIRTTDLKKRPTNYPGEKIYAEYTRLVRSHFGKGTQDSIRKNLFVDFDRMGLIERFGKDKEKTDPFGRKSVKFVSISKMGLKLIDPNIDLFNKYLVFTNALDSIMKGFATDLLDVITELKYLEIHELQYFVTYLYHEYQGKIVDKETVVSLVKQFRLMSSYQIQSVHEYLKTRLVPSLQRGDKTAKRDYHNWLNESQQIVNLLKMTVFYEVDLDNKKIRLRIGKGSIFSNHAKIKRSMTQKNLYFKNHELQKRVGFELHHIVPLSWAASREEFFVLDQWDNMIYIDAYSHAKISQNSNKNVKLIYFNNSNDLEFKDFSNNSVYCKFEKNTIYKVPLISEIIDKNSKLLERI